MSRIPDRIHDFATDELGAVTTDWVLLSASLVFLGVASVGTQNNGGVGVLAGQIANQLSNGDIVFQSRYFGRSVVDLAAEMPVDNRSETWRRNRASRLQERSTASLQNQLERWRRRTPDNSPHSQNRIDFEIRVRELELERRGVS